MSQVYGEVKMSTGLTEESRFIKNWFKRKTTPLTYINKQLH